MFENLGWTWKREPVLYITLLIAIGNLVRDFVTDVATLETLIVGILTLLLGFVARGQVTPMAGLEERMAPQRRKGGR